MQTPTTFSGLVTEILNVISLIIPVIFSVVFIFLIWKVIDAWVINVGDEKKRAEGKVYLTVAVVVFVLMIATWGIVNLIISSFLS